MKSLSIFLFFCYEHFPFSVIGYFFFLFEGAEQKLDAVPIICIILLLYHTITHFSMLYCTSPPLVNFKRTNILSPAQVYSTNFKKKSKKNKNRVTDDKGNKCDVVVDGPAVLFLVGTEMDYIEVEMGSEFVFQNPNEKDKCGCGQSFNVHEDKKT